MSILNVQSTGLQSGKGTGRIPEELFNNRQYFLTQSNHRKSIEYNLGVQLLLIDFKKAFDGILHEYLWRAMANQRINEYWIRILKNIYGKSRAYVKLEKKGISN